jgi:hypothetical protein
LGNSSLDSWKVLRGRPGSAERPRLYQIPRHRSAHLVTPLTGCTMETHVHCRRWREFPFA